MILLDSAVFILTALLLLILPLDWLLSAVIASFFHELCHILAVYMLKGNITRIQIHARGCVLETDRMEARAQFLSILAGPVGSFLLLLFSHIVPKIALCGFLQGIYNIIPVLPLDGGRLLRLFLYRYCPRQAKILLDVIAIGTCIVMDVLLIWLSTAGVRGIWPLVFALVWNVKSLPRKIPCKPLKSGVQ